MINELMYKPCFVPLLEDGLALRKKKQVFNKLLSWKKECLFLNQHPCLELDIICASKKSQVFKMKSKDNSIFTVKHHEYLKNFKNELMAYLILRGSGIASLYAYSIEKKLFIFKFYSRPYQYHTPQGLIDYAKFLGTMHGMVIPKLQTQYPFYSMQNMNMKNFKFKCPKYAKEFLQSLIYRVGKSYVSFSISDQKKEHFFQDRKKMIMLDLETFQMGRFEHFDLLFCINLSENAYISKEEEEKIFETYCFYRGKKSRIFINKLELKEEYNLFCKAIGAESLRKFWGDKRDV